MIQTICISSEGKSRTIGQFSNGIFYKTVVKSKHLYQADNAWGLDAKFFNEFLLKKGVSIVIFDKEEGKYYVSSIENFKERGHFMHFKPYRPQIFLKLNFFTIYDKFDDFIHGD